MFSKKKKNKKRKKARKGTNVRVLVFNVGLLDRSRFAPEKSFDRPTRSRFSVVSLGPRANTELVPKFHVPLRASHAALPMVLVAPKIST
jgi:hypothetical protein